MGTIDFRLNVQLTIISKEEYFAKIYQWRNEKKLFFWGLYLGKVLDIYIQPIKFEFQGKNMFLDVTEKFGRVLIKNLDENKKKI